MQCSKLNAADK